MKKEETNNKLIETFERTPDSDFLNELMANA